MERKTPTTDLKIHLEAKARRATKRPKSVGSKTVSTPEGAKTRVTSLDANSATFGDDFLYVFKNNVRRARKGGRGAK
jgi:hypothetical protein